MRTYFILLLISIGFLSGCANGVSSLASDLDPQIEHNNKKMFVGIPILFGLEASSVRLDENWILTAKHNKVLLNLLGIEAYYHPHCDIALIPEQGKGHSKVGLVYRGESVVHIGYPMAFPLAENHGIYLGEVLVDSWQKCVMSASTGVIATGMSGGGVYNKQGELVGINHGYVSSKINWEDHADWSNHTAHNPSVFLALFAVKDWLNNTTGQDYFLSTHL